ncbi:MAG: hypothetical protein QW334_00140 [Thermofilum sp.]
MGARRMTGEVRIPTDLYEKLRGIAEEKKMSVDELAAGIVSIYLLLREGGAATPKSRIGKEAV